MTLNNRYLRKRGMYGCVFSLDEKGKGSFSFFSLNIVELLILF